MRGHATRMAGAVLPLVAALGFAASAHAAPVVGPSGNAFYTPPAPLPAGANGDLVWYRPTTVDLGPGAPAVNAYTVLYRSTDSAGQPIPVTGTVMVPTARVSGYRRIVSYAFGTQGLGQQCAPSKQLVAGTEYEKGNVIAALKRGWAVVGSDYAGYTAGSKTTYSAGAAQGAQVLDVIKAAAQIPSGGVDIRARAAIWGYSIGGQAAAWAGERHKTYAPTVNLVGVAAGGVPADLSLAADYLNGSAGASFALQSIVGLSEQYPTEVPFDTLSNDAGKAARADVKTKCVFEALNSYINADIKDYTAGNLTLDQLKAIPSVAGVIAAQKLGTTKPSTSTFLYHGQADEFIPLGQAHVLKKAYCAKTTRVKFNLYPSEHLTTLVQAAPEVTNWIYYRFAGSTAPSDCSSTKPPPVSTAPPQGGDFLVNLTNWSLTGTTSLAKLGQTIKLPSTSSFTGSANLTDSDLSGTVKIPPFATTISLAGLPVKVSLDIRPSGSVFGDVSLDNDGQLHLDATAPVYIYLKNVTVGITLGTNCRTRYPVLIPLKFDGPVTALGDSTLKFASIASFSELIDCGLYGPLLSQIFSGPGQRFNITLAPRAPVSN